MDIISTIIPIFIIIFLGIFARHKGFLSQAFLHQANRLVYFIAIPAMLKGMALPMALLVIGASLSFEKIRLVFASVVMTSVLKLLVMPAMGLVLFKLFGISASDFIPGLIILAAPSATLVYIMAEQIGGDPDLAVAAISVSTLVSGLTYGIWLSAG